MVFVQFHKISNNLAAFFESPCRVIGYEHGNKFNIKPLSLFRVKVVHLDYVKRVLRTYDDGEQLSALPPVSAPQAAP